MVDKVLLAPVVSGHIAAAGYDRARQLLAIQFKRDRAIRVYAGVPPELAEAFARAESKGTVYHGRIRRHFRGQRVTGPCRACKAEGYIGDVCQRCGTDRHFGLARAGEESRRLPARK